MHTRWLPALVLGAYVLPAHAELLEIAPDLYLLTRDGRFASRGDLKFAAIREAQQFAASKGMVAIPIARRELSDGAGFSVATYEYQFRLLRPEEAVARKATLAPLADVVITTTGKAEAADLYTELIRLDVLRQRGLLTPEEFRRKKEELLDAPVAAPEPDAASAPPAAPPGAPASPPPRPVK